MDIVQQEIIKQEKYEKLYERTHKKPTRKEISFWKELGADAVGLILSSVGSIILSAVRTSTVFMLIEVLLLAVFDQDNLLPAVITSSFPMISMASSLVAFEGLLFSHGYSKGKRSGRTNANVWAVAVSFAITIVAGFVASFGLLNLDMTNPFYVFVMWVLAVLVAVGAPVVVYFGSMNLGALANYWKELQANNESSFIAEEKQWYTNMLSSMNKKGGKALLSGLVFDSDDNEQVEIPTKRTSSKKRTPKVRQNKKPRKSSTKNEQRTRITELFATIYKSEHRVAGVTEVARIIAAEELGNRANEQNIEALQKRKKGYVSTVRREWANTNSIVL